MGIVASYTYFPIAEALSDNKIDENNLFDAITVLKYLITNKKKYLGKIKEY